MSDKKRNRWVRRLPNCITSLRILGALILFWVRPLTPWFYGVYSLCGISDVVDGCVARATKTTSRLGAILDSIADLLFYGVMLVRLFPMLWARLPGWVWVMFALVLLIRLGAYLTAAVKYRRFASSHTYLNKLTGLMVFLMPYLWSTGSLTAYCAVGCVVGGLASAEELCIYLREPVYRPERKTILMK